jgi:peptidyl-prolyl cis-trans isomerase B (cyclophilin B)
VPSNEQRRNAAKRKLERQLERRQQRAKRRKKVLLGSGAGVLVLALVAVGLVLWNNHREAVAAQHAAYVDAHTCSYKKTPEAPAPKGKDVGLPPNPVPTPTKGTVKVDLKTTQGEIPLTLDRSKAPCTVQSFVHLVKKNFYDKTPCHRLTADTMLKVLQCGDPTGTGQGGPGYTIPDEKPKHLPAPPKKIQQKIKKLSHGRAPKISTYPRGTVAMAKTRKPNSGGSQFFLVYGDSYLKPNYTVFGTVSKKGLATLDKISKGGIKATKHSRNPKNPKDGAPKLPVKITSATVTDTAR